MDSIKVFQLCAFLLSIQLIISFPLVVNATSFKTVKTEYGDIYDCVDLYKQPALQHPLLKDHKIQMRPNYSTQKNVSGGKSFHSNGWKSGCRPGTVPIRRTTEEEKLKANDLFRQVYFQGSGVSATTQENRFAGVSASKRVEEAGGYMSTHNPTVGKGQLSGSVLSIEYGAAQTFGVIRVGWMVYPDLFNADNRTRLYISWGQFHSGGVNGCFNLLCAGFVQTNHDIAIDKVIDEISVPSAEYSYIKLGLSVDDHKSWWFNYGEDETPIGYWPKELFTGLQNDAQVVRFGGWVATQTQEFPMMGSGLLGNVGSQMRQLYADAHKLKGDGTKYQVSLSPCFKAGINSFGNEDYWGYSFWYGGNAAQLQQCPTQSI